MPSMDDLKDFDFEKKSGDKFDFGEIVKWGKKNPIIILLLVIGIIFIFFTIRRNGQTQEQAGAGALPARPIFPQGQTTARPTIPVAPQVTVDVPQVEIRHDPITVTVPQPTVAFQRQITAIDPDTRGEIFYYEVGHQAYKQAMAEAHRNWSPGVPTREVRNGKIRTVEHGFQTIEQVEARQRARFDRAMAEGRRSDAEMVRQETEIATGRRTGW